MYRQILEDAYASLGWKLPLLVLMMLIASFLEGISLTMLMPLLTQFGLRGKGEGDAGALAQQVDETLRWLGVPSELGPLMVFLVVILLLQVGMTMAVRFLETSCTTYYTADWRKRLFRTVIGANWKYLQDTKVEVQTNQIMGETSRNSAALSLFLQIINGNFFVAVYALIALFTSWEVVVGLSVIGFAIYMITRPISNLSRKTGVEVTTVSEVLFGQTQEFLLNAKLIKSTATEKTAQLIVNEAIDNYRVTYFKAGMLPALIQMIYMGLGYIILGSGVWFGITYSSVSSVAIIVTIYVFLRLYTQLSNIQQLRQSFLLSAPALVNCQNELRAATECQEHKGDDGIVLDDEGGAEIDIKNLAIDYGDHRALDSINIKIPAGSVLGLTGPSGAGKSTLVDAIVGLVLPSEGMVHIDGHPITSLPPLNWRQHIGYVAQETIVIKGTVAENIAWGKVGATPAEIREAAVLANADEFISTMPQGYDTIIGGRSVRMSGGQRQRIGMARALLGARRLLILDEATSALDSDSEAKVMEAVEKLRGKVTVIMVAHRLSTLKHADELLVFEQGKIVERGTFSALSQAGGAFHRLWDIQSTINPSRQENS